jgi:hypothetical protein
MVDQAAIDLKQDLVFKHDCSSYLFKKFKIGLESVEKCKELTKDKTPVKADLEDELELT